MTPTSRDLPRDPAKRLAGMEYDFRRPTIRRTRARWWNPDDPRLLTPKSFGWGFGLNLYWLAHPARWIAHRRQR